MKNMTHLFDAFGLLPNLFPAAVTFVEKAHLFDPNGVVTRNEARPHLDVHTLGRISVSYKYSGVRMVHTT